MVSTSVLVQPLDSSAAHFVYWAVLVGSFHGMLPLYRPFHCSTLCTPIIR